MNSISVIIPLYNREDTIIGCLSSIVNQSHPPDEVIVVDDGSTDNSRSVFEKWLSSADTGKVEIKYLSQENRGKSAALNTGVEASSGDWVAFNDSDDIWLPKKIETQMTLLARHPEIDACLADSGYANNSELNQTGFEISNFSESQLVDGVLQNSHRYLARNPNGFFMQSMLVRRKLIPEIFPMNPDLRVAQDIDLIFRVSLLTDYCVCYETLVQIDRTPSRSIGLTKEHNMKSVYRLKIKEQIMCGWLSIQSERLNEARKAISNRLSSLQHSIAKELFSINERQEARLYLKKAITASFTAKSFLRFVYTNLIFKFKKHS